MKDKASSILWFFSATADWAKPAVSADYPRLNLHIKFDLIVKGSLNLIWKAIHIRATNMSHLLGIKSSFNEIEPQSPGTTCHVASMSFQKIKQIRKTQVV